MPHKASKYYVADIWDSLRNLANESLVSGGSVLIAGDFNARMGSSQSPIDVGFFNGDEDFESASVYITRASDDVIRRPNHHGNKLDDLCQEVSLINIHGLRRAGHHEFSPGDFHQSLTFHKQNTDNKSAIDYALVDWNSLHLVRSFHVLQHNEAYSDHAPTLTTIEIPASNDCQPPPAQADAKPTRVWPGKREWIAIYGR